MDLKQLEYFVSVAELGGFTRASITLDVAQPVLSRQIRLLEVELRQPLLIRNGRGVLPTEAGRLLLEHARGVLNQLARTREALDQARDALTGHITIGLPPSLSRALTVPLTRQFRQRLPDATLTISEGLSSPMLESLVSGRLDTALVYHAYAAPATDVSLTPLYEERWYHVSAAPYDRAASSEPITMAEIASLPLLIPSRNNATRILIDNELARLGLQAQVVIEVDSIAAILDLVADRQGSAVLSLTAIKAMGGNRAFEFRPIVSPMITSPLNLAVSSRRPATPTQKAAIALLRECVHQVIRQQVSTELLKPLQT